MDTQSELNYLANMKPPDTFGHPKYQPYDLMNHHALEISTQMMPTQPLVTHVEHIPPPPAALAGNGCMPFVPVLPTLGVSPLIQTQPPQLPPPAPPAPQAAIETISSHPLAIAVPPNVNNNNNNNSNSNSSDFCNNHTSDKSAVIVNNNNNNSMESSSNAEAPKRKLSTEVPLDGSQYPPQKKDKLQQPLPPIDEKKKRKNIRDVMDTNQLDTITLKAQHEESERLARMAEQQKLLREYQQREAVLTHFDRFVNEHRVKNPEDLLELNGSPKNQALPDSGIGKSMQTVTETESTETEDGEIKEKTPAEVVTIEDSSSDDDCIVLSDDEEDVEEDMDDPENSGLHVKDEFNIPDHLGRVVINVGHPDNEEDIYIAPQIARTIKPHQIGGIRFLFDNIIESTTRFKTSGGFGCILAHSMGLGKTLQVVCFCDIFLRYTPSRTVVCVMPINTLQNWQAEFDMWIPKVSDNYEYIRPRQFDVFVLNDQHKTFTARARVIQQWKDQGGVLLIGYELFRLMALKLSTTGRKRSKRSQLRNDEMDESHHRLLDEIYEALVKPGPDLVICDEGHRIKNSQAGISQALKQIRTRRRIVLTGYPLQNNLVEYWCMVDFVRPNYLGTKTEFCNMFERPIQNGLCVDSTPDDIKLMRYRAHVLHSLLLGFVQRRSHTVLQQSLPEKQEFVILARMTELQRQLYDTFMNDIVRTKNVPNPLKAFAVCCKIWNHPDVLYDAMKVAEYGLDVDIEEVEEIAPTTPSLNKDGFPMPPQPAPPPPSPLLTASANAAGLVNAALNGNMQMTQTTPGCLQQQLNSTALDLNSNASTLAGQQQIDRTDFVQQNNNNNNHNNYNMNFSNLSGGGGHTQNSSALTSIMNPTNTNDPMNYQNNTSTPLYGDLNHYGGDSNSALNSTLNNSYQSSDLQSPYFAYSSMLSSMGSPLKPNYVGCMVKQATTTDTNNVHLDDTHNSSSEIVDLDTKEIKTIETDIDMDKNIHLNKSKEDAEKCITAAETGTMPATLTKTGGIESENKSELDISSLSGLNAALESNDQEQRRGCDKITYDWAAKYMKKYESGLISNSPKMTIFFCILNESVRIGDRVLLFSQSLLTLNAIEKFLMANQMPGENTSWTYGRHYFRLDGSTTSQERERLVNEFNTNVNVKLFLISTKAGSLGINLVGANRVIIFDASWNPCHDTQAIYRIYRYGQKRACFVYRIVMDKCLEKKIYDRQIKKQGMSDRVVDECNPDNHLSIKDVTNLCYDYDDDDDKHTAIEFKKPLDSYTDTIMRKILIEYKVHLTKEPFFHESLLVDRKNDKLSQAEKRMAHRSYEMQKKTSSKNTFISTGSRVQFQTVRKDGALITKPIASVRPMQAPRSQTQKYSSGLRTTRWIPAEVWQKQGMTAQEMSLPLDVVIPTNSSNKSKIIIKAGQRVMVLKSAKGIYMQLDSGKIIAIRTMNKPNAINKGDKPDVIDITGESETANDAKTDKAETDTTNSSFTDSSMDVDSSTSTSSSLQKAIKTELDKSSEETHKTQQQQAAENLTQTQSQFHQLALFNNTTTTTNTKVASNNNNHKTAAAAVNTYHHNNRNNSNSTNTNTVNPLKNEDKLNLRGGGGIQAQQQQQQHHTTINEQRQQMRMAVSINPQSLLIQQRKQQQQQQQNQQTQPRTGLTQSANENLHQHNSNNNTQHNNSNNSTQQQQQSHATTTTATTQAHNLQQQSTANSYTAANHHAANAAAAAAAAAHQHHSHHHGQTYYAPTHAYAAAAASQGHHSQSSNLRNTHHYGTHARSASDISPYGAYATAQYTDFPAYASHDTLAQQNARYHGGSGTHGNLSQAHATTLSDFYASYYPQWSPFMLPPPPPTSAAAAAAAANTNDTNHLMHHSYPSAHAHSAHPLPKVQSANNTGPSQWQQYQ